MPDKALIIEPTAGRFDRADARWLDEVASLHEALRAAEPMTRRQNKPVVGTKGVVSDIIVPLVSAGTLTGIIEAVRLWLDRDEGRSLRLKFDSAGRPSEFELTGKSLTTETCDSIVTSVLASLGDG